MLKSLIFYRYGYLVDIDVKIYYDNDLPLFWDVNRKCIVLDIKKKFFTSKNIRHYHNKGLMRFNDPNQIDDFIYLCGFGDRDVYLEFSKNWGSWDFSKIMNFGDSQDVYPSFFKKNMVDYPEFLLDTGDYIEEMVGIELQDGMGILPFSNVKDFSQHVRKLVDLFLIREKYLKCEEVLLSREYSSWIEDTSFSYLKEKFKKHFDVSTFKLVGSKTTERDGFKIFLDEVEIALADSYKHPGLLFYRYVCGEGQYFLETFFTLEASTAAVEEFFTSGELDLPGLRSSLEKTFYGSSGHFACSILLDSPRVSFMYTSESSFRKTFVLTTTIRFS